MTASTTATPAEAICRAVRGEPDFVPGVTAVHTPASEAWAARTGVYQDTAHVSLRVLRAVGIPARYVSGYRYPLSGGDLGQTVVGEYPDVAPLRGIYAGTGTEDLAVVVQITREA